MGNKSDDEYTVDGGLETKPPSPSDPTPSLLERKDAQKRTASPSIMKDLLKPRYQKNDSLKCLDGDEVYSARCVKIEHDGNQYSYLIHYNGWSKSYDEWMFDDDPRLNPEKVEKITEALPQPTPKPPPKAPKPKTGKAKKSTKHRAHEAVKVKNHPRSGYENRFVFRLHLPYALKTVLQDDQEFILRQRKVIPIPAVVNVKTILNTFVREGKHDQSVLEGVEKYFNAIVGARLLYKFERPLFGDYLAPFRSQGADAQTYPPNAKPPCELFGFTQLVRFVYHLDEVFSDVDVEKDALRRQIAKMQLLVDFLARKASSYHAPSQYIETSPEYHRRAQV